MAGVCDTYLASWLDALLYEPSEKFINFLLDFDTDCTAQRAVCHQIANKMDTLKGVAEMLEKDSGGENKDSLKVRCNTKLHFSMCT